MSGKKNIIGVDFGTDSVRSLIVDTFNGKETTALAGLSIRRKRERGSPIKRHLSREKSVPTVRGVSSSPSVVRIGVGDTNQ